MKTAIHYFWQALEQLVGLSAVKAEWSCLLGGELEWAAGAKLLVASGALATVYPREPGKSPSLLPYDVVMHGDDDYVGVCPHGWGTVRLTREQLMLWELDVRRLGKEIAGALSVSAAFEADVQPFTSRIGFFRARGDAVPVYVTLPLERGHITAAAWRLAGIHKPCVVLAPTRRLLTDECHSAFHLNRMCFAALNELLPAAGSGGRLVAAQSLSHLVAEVRPPDMRRDGRNGTGPRPDGCYGARTIVYRGREHTCELTNRDRAFLDVALKEAEVDVHQLMHPRDGLLFKARYVNDDERKRNRISQFLTRLSKRLSNAKPPLRVHFSLPRSRDYVFRDDPPDGPLAADSSLTRE